jgi:hypothetical protein
VDKTLLSKFKVKVFSVAVPDAKYRTLGATKAASQLAASEGRHWHRALMSSARLSASVFARLGTK